MKAVDYKKELQGLMSEVKAVQSALDKLSDGAHIMSMNGLSNGLHGLSLRLSGLENRLYQMSENVSKDLSESEHSVPLDAYEAANLRAFLEWAGSLANTGDWYNQVLHKLHHKLLSPATDYFADYLVCTPSGYDARLYWEIVAGRKTVRAPAGRQSSGTPTVAKYDGEDDGA